MSKPIVLNGGELMDKILTALDRRKPCPVVSLEIGRAHV